MQKINIDMQKGLTPVIAIILVLLITIATTGIALVYFTRFSGAAEESGERALKSLINQSVQSFAIESVDGNKIYISNTGTSDLSGFSVYLDNRRVESADISIPFRSTGVLLIDDSKIILSPNPAEIKVATAGYTDKASVNFYENHLIAYWKMDGNAKDSSRNRNHGELMGGMGCIAQGVYGTACEFDGDDDYIRVPLSDSFDLQDENEVTIEAWINVKGNFRGAAYSGIAASHTGCWENNPYRLLIRYANNKLFGAIGGESNAGCSDVPEGYYKQQVSWIGDYTPDAWNHVILSVSGSKICGYVNGIEKCAERSASVPEMTYFRGNYVFIGIFYNGTANTFGNMNGTIDEVRILNIARPMKLE